LKMDNLDNTVAASNKCGDAVSREADRKKALLYRLTDTRYLYPPFAEIIEDLLLAINQHQMPFRLYETYRTPQRQKELIKLGFSKQRIPLKNSHVNGLAVDFLLDYRVLRTFDKSAFERMTSSHLSDRDNPVSDAYAEVYRLGVNMVGTSTQPARTLVEDPVILGFWNDLGTLIQRQYPQLSWHGTKDMKPGQLIGVDPPHIEMKGAPRLIQNKIAMASLRTKDNPGLEEYLNEK